MYAIRTKTHRPIASRISWSRTKENTGFLRTNEEPKDDIGELTQAFIKRITKFVK